MYCMCYKAIFTGARLQPIKLHTAYIRNWMGQLDERHYEIGPNIYFGPDRHKRTLPPHPS